MSDEALAALARIVLKQHAAMLNVVPQAVMLIGDAAVGAKAGVAALRRLLAVRNPTGFVFTEGPLWWVEGVLRLHGRLIERFSATVDRSGVQRLGLAGLWTRGGGYLTRRSVTAELFSMPVI